MSNSKFFNPKRLTLDVYVYLFTEWLVRQHVYRRFTANSMKALKEEGPADQFIRDYVRRLLTKPYFSMNSAVVAAFPFDATPEGVAFWQHASDEWISFLSNFHRK